MEGKKFFKAFSLQFPEMSSLWRRGSGWLGYCVKLLRKQPFIAGQFNCLTLEMMCTQGCLQCYLFSISFIETHLLGLLYIITLNLCSTDKLFLTWSTLCPLSINKPEHSSSPRTSRFWFTHPLQIFVRVQYRSASTLLNSHQEITCIYISIFLGFPFNILDHFKRETQKSF